MPRCINIESPEYKKLKEETNLKDSILKVKIESWQNKQPLENGEITDKFPSKEELLKFTSKNTITQDRIKTAIKDLENIEKATIVKKTDELLQIIKNQWFRLGFSINKEVRDIFNNEFVGNEFKELYEKLKSVADKSDEGINFERKVRTFAISMSEMNNLVDKIQDKIRQTDYKSMDEKDALTELAKYNTFLNEWSQNIEVMRPLFLQSPEFLSILDTLEGNIKTTKSLMSDSRNFAVVNILTEDLSHTSKKQQEDLQERISRIETKIQNATKRGDTKAAENYQKQLDKEKERYSKIAVTASDVLDYLTGLRGDTNIFSGYLEALLNSPDPITFAAKKRLTDITENIYQDIRGVDMAFQREAEPLLKELHASRFNVFDFNKQFVQQVSRKDSQGDYNQLELLNEFNPEWQTDLDEFFSKINEAKLKGDEEAERQTKMELAKWRAKYMHQEFLPIVYERYELWDDEVGQEAYKQRQAIFDEMNAISRKLNNSASEGFDLSEEEEIQYQEQLYKLNRLASTYDIEGNPKTGMQLEITKRIQEYNKLTKGIYEWKPKSGAFQRAYDRYEEYVDTLVQNDPTVDKQTLLDKWLTNNTRFVIKPEWYATRQAILNQLNYLSKKLKDKIDSEKVTEFSHTWEKIFDQIKGYRDSDGQPIGSEISESKTQKIKEEQELLEKLKSSMEGLSGLTPDESDELSRYWALIKAGLRLTQEQNTRKTYLENKRNSLGLSKEESKKFYELVSQLADIQAKIPTEYYLEQLNQLTSPLGKSYDTVTAEELLQSPELTQLLENEEFKEWFEKNHIKVSRFNPETKSKIQRYERLYTWNRIVPTDEIYLEKTKLENGKEIIGLPSLKYYYRDIKDQYKTDKIVGKTIDNRGNWLPRSYNKRGELDAQSDKYINKEYFRLRDSKDPYDVAKFKLLEVYKKYLLLPQDGLPYQDRLWLTIPSVRKHVSERLRAGDFAGIKQNILERLNIHDRTSIDEEENNKPQPTENEKRVVKADIYGNEINSIPIKFTGKLDADNVSLNLGKSIIQYNLSAETKKELTKEQPILKALEDMLESYGVKDENKIKIAYQKIVSAITGKPELSQTEVPIVKKGTSNRLTNIRNLEDAYLNGIYKRGVFSKNRTFVDEIADAVFFNPLKRLGGFAALSFDFSGAITNQISGNIYLILDGITGRSFSNKDYTIAVAEFHSKLIPAFIQDSLEPLGKKSLYGQLFDLYDPQQEASHTLGEKFGTNGWLKVGEEFKEVFLKTRKFGEIQIAASVMLAMMNNKTVQTKNGPIRLTDAYELNPETGLIQLKPDVEFSKSDFNFFKGEIRQALRETQGNYASADKTELERFSAGAILYFFRRYFTPIFLDAFQAFRFNGYGASREGYNLTAFRVLKLGLEGIRDFGLKQTLQGESYVSALPTRDRLTLLKAMSFWCSTLVFMLLIAQLDPDDERRKYKKTKEWSFWKLQLLLQAIRVKQEVEQMTPIGGVNDMLRMVKNPLMIGNKLSQMSTLSGNIYLYLKDDPKADYSRGYKTMMEDVYGTDNKALINFYKFLGYRGGGIKAFIPGTQESQEATAYRLKQTVAATDRN